MRISFLLSTLLLSNFSCMSKKNSEADVKHTLMSINGKQPSALWMNNSFEEL